MTNDALGDRMKGYEMAEAGRRLMPQLPVLARIDGRSFSKFTRGMDRPFDARFSRAMEETTAALVRATNAVVGYTQSDEITLLWHATAPEEQVFFDGRIMKMTSNLAALATLFFVRAIEKEIPGSSDKLPTFDARVWNVPTRAEAANVFLWRELDASKNSVSMAARHHFAHTELHGLSSKQMQQRLLLEAQVNWNDLPARFIRGVYARRRITRTKYSPEEFAALPAKHNARTQPDLEVERSDVVLLELPPLPRIENRVEVLFEDATPTERTAVGHQR